MSIRDLITLGIGPGGSPSGTILMGISPGSTPAPPVAYDAKYAPLGYYAPLGTYRYLGKGEDRDRLLYTIQIDWNMDGVYEGWNESRWLIPGTLEVNRGRENFLRRDGSGFERIAVGTCSLELDNSSGRYDPRNTSSPLYPHLLTTDERNAKIQIRNGESGTPYGLITGRMVDFVPSSDGRGRKKLRVRIEDAMLYLNNRETNIDIRADIKTNEAIGAVLDDIAWPLSRSLEVAVETIPYWWVFGKSPYVTVWDLTESELGQFFVDVDGVATFQSRYHVDNNPLALNSAEISPEILESQPSETMRNKVVVKIHPRVRRATGVLWILQDAPGFLSAGGEKELWPEYTYNSRPVPAQNVITPVSTTDYTAYSNSSGSGGTDLTGNLSVTLHNFGEGGKLTLRNTGATGLYYWIQIRGDALDAPDTVAAKSGSGDRVFTLDLPWQQKIASGQDAADYLYEALSNPNKYYLTISVSGMPNKQFSKDLMGWISLTVTSRVISSIFRISKIRHKAIKINIVQTTYWIEPLVGINTDDANNTQLPFQLPAQL
jgi:hypothetical protein